MTPEQLEALRWLSELPDGAAVFASMPVERSEILWAMGDLKVDGRKVLRRMNRLSFAGVRITDHGRLVLEMAKQESQTKRRQFDLFDVDQEQLVRDLVASGYRATSTRHRAVARLDREDWREHMAAAHCKDLPDQEEAMRQAREWVASLVPRRAAQVYRRVLSKDHIENLPEAAFDKIHKVGAGWGWGLISEYVPLVGVCVREERPE